MALGAKPPQLGPNEIDASTFLLDFAEGKAARYKGFTVKGEGTEFYVSLMGSMPQGPLQLTIGAIGRDEKATDQPPAAAG